MRLIKPSFEVIDAGHFDTPKIIELCGRVCYKSEEKITADSSRNFIKARINTGHESILEHEKATVRIICDRGVTHEIVRHRIGSYSQESTRYCNYTGNVTFIIPPWVNKIIEPGDDYSYAKVYDLISRLAILDRLWLESMYKAEQYYIHLLAHGWTPQQARSVLPNSLKTEIIITYNLREWRHFFKLRTAKAAHPQMREITIPMLHCFQILFATLFDDIKIQEESNDQP